MLVGWGGSFLIGLFVIISGLFWNKGGMRRRKGKRKVERKGKEKNRTLQFLHRLPTRQVVASDDLTRVQAHYEEVFRLLEELASKDHDCFRTVRYLGEDERF